VLELLESIRELETEATAAEKTDYREGYLDALAQVIDLVEVWL
jgi:hypothetical protein